ncbi:glycosyltransferase family 4 protein [uncultured Micrococcus sp.]|uniref:glycosyltransferase family 4 protein n=1 Tax=uncultured Micrococcus sp. TaxID=114051 RepID=UPI002596B78C|nr:glycosyltransferase family 4 protein [uncultured Micrococcus sp.]
MSERIAVISPLFPPGVRGGGPIRTLAAMVASAPATVDLQVFTKSRDHGAAEDMVDVVNTPTDYHGVPVLYAQVHRPAGVAALLRGLREYRPDALYLNSYWSLFYSQAVMALRRVGVFGRVKAVVAPRGEFAREALDHHGARKKVLRAVNRLTGMYADVTWHASSEREAADIRAYIGGDARIVVHENDSLLPERASEPVAAAGGTGLRAVFVGRLLEHKGALLAAQAVAAAGEGVSLDVYGPEEDAEYVRRLEQVASESGGRVRLHGMLASDEVRDRLTEYDALLMPTRSENFGHVIAEALSASVPVVVPDVTPWTELLREHSAGVIIDRSVDGLGEALRVLSGSGEHRLASRRRAAEAFNAWRAETLHRPHVLTVLRERGALGGQTSGPGPVAEPQPSSRPVGA